MNLLSNTKDAAFSKSKIININIDDVNCNQLTSKISRSIKEREKLIINYANANSIRIIENKKEFKLALNCSNIIHSDGIGIWLASGILKSPKLINRFNFTDCALNFLKNCQENGWSLFLLGANDKILSSAKNNLENRFPNLNIVGMLNGYNDITSKNVIEIINLAKPDILWIGMGTPKQEMWIKENKDFLDCLIIQSVGDLITHLASKKERGPLIVQKMGLEWTIRLINHPFKYFDRYILGIPIFLFLLIRELANKRLFKI